MPMFSSQSTYFMFFLVDAFTEKPFLGNPAGVCVMDDISDSSRMQKMAAFFNWSEIAFVEKLTERQFKLRWFSPCDEVPLCGHATLAAAQVLFSKGVTTSTKIEFTYRDGTLFAEQNGDLITLSFPAKPVEKCNRFPFEVKDLVGDVEYESVWKDDLVYMIVLKDPNTVKSVEPNLYQIAKVEARAIVITSRGEQGFDCYSRYFAPRVGIPEDPVCGSAHCRLACYWGAVLGKKKLRAFQASHRTGIMDLELTDTGIVRISARASIVAELSSLRF